jgi:hypothetical protein
VIQAKTDQEQVTEYPRRVEAEHVEHEPLEDGVRSDEETAEDEKRAARR